MQEVSSFLHKVSLQILTHTEEETCKNIDSVGISSVTTSIYYVDVLALKICPHIF